MAICSHPSHTIFPILPELVLTHGRRNLANPPHRNNITTDRDHGDVNREELNNHDEQNEGRRVRAIGAKCRVVHQAKSPSPQNGQREERPGCDGHCLQQSNSVIALKEGIEYLVRHCLLRQ